MLARLPFIIGLAASVAFASPSEAGTLGTFDMQSMQAIFDQIFTGIDKTVLDIKAYNGDAAGLAAIVTDTNGIQASLNAGAATMKKSAAMSLPDILNILGPVSVMENKVGEVVDTLSKRKADFEKAGASATILEQLTKLKIAADVLVPSITGNLPMQAIVGPFAGPIAKTITDRLNKGYVEWGGQPIAAAAPKGQTAPKAAKGKGAKGGKTPPAAGTASALLI
jgi:hypothetical protein